MGSDSRGQGILANLSGPKGVRGIGFVGQCPFGCDQASQRPPPEGPSSSLISVMLTNNLSAHRFLGLPRKKKEGEKYAGSDSELLSL